MSQDWIIIINTPVSFYKKWDLPNVECSEGFLWKKINDILTAIGVNKKARITFLVHLFPLFLSLRARTNFMNMERYGIYVERTYRNHFENDFNFFDFNYKLIRQPPHGEQIIAVDCYYIPKSGKQTPHKAMFWTGCHGKALPGLELSSICVVDIEHNSW